MVEKWVVELVGVLEEIDRFEENGLGEAKERKEIKRVLEI